MSNVRVTYSGLISFVIGLISVITGIIFTLIITRRLSPEEFGTWGLVGGLITYVLISEPIISFWLIRQTARGKNFGKTPIYSSAIFSAIGMGVYILIAYYVGLQSDADLSGLLLATILIPFLFITKTLTAIALGYKPQLVSYGILAFETIKIPFGLIFVYFLDLGIDGAILATAIAYLGNLIVLAILVRDKIKEKFQFNVLKNWIRLSWIPLYSNVSELVFSLDVLIFLVITGSVVGVAYFAVGLTVVSLIGHSGLITRGLYAKLLAGGEKIHLQENLRLFFYFAFPLSALTLSFAKPALFALNPIYVIVVPVVLFLTIRGFLYQFNRILYTSLQGIEEVDINEKSTFRDYIKSKLAFLPTLRLIEFSLYVITLAIILLIDSKGEQLDLVIRWSVVILFVQIPFSIYLYMLIRKNFILKVGFVSLIKYLVTSVIVFGITFYFMNEHLVYNEKIFEFIPSLIPYLVLSVGSYILITYSIDSKTRNLVKGIINEFKH